MARAGPLLLRALLIACLAAGAGCVSREPAQLALSPALAPDLAAEPPAMPAADADGDDLPWQLRLTRL